MSEERIQAIGNLLQNEAFISELQQAEDFGKIVILFADYGVPVTPEELGVIQEEAINEEGELYEDELENVAGGTGFGRAALLGLKVVLKNLPKHVNPLPVQKKN